jgi:hypothetical protein
VRVTGETVHADHNGLVSSRTRVKADLGGQRVTSRIDPLGGKFLGAWVEGPLFGRQHDHVETGNLRYGSDHHCVGMGSVCVETLTLPGRRRRLKPLTMPVSASQVV